ncbi:MAG: formylglycine-generating enzyme family protein [Betaproteobacteria bacterium]|nr:formylglycine-generating enzyme family protein [Betaproteobacteria bacterium]
MRILLSASLLITLLTGNFVQAEPKKIFKDCPQCPEMITIPSGKFLMGTKSLSSRQGLSEEQLKYAGEFEEYPQHEVIIKSFSMGVHEVTQKEWVFVMGSNPSENKGDDLPVENITWEEAKAFAHKLSEITGKNYRLPTEAEWEYAARAGSGSIFHFGDNPAGLAEYAWFRDNSDGKSHKAGTKKANPFGLYDMLGNVWERTEDCWHIDYEDAPADGSAWESEDCEFRVVRGGAWVNHAQFLRSAFRFRYAPGSRYEFVGVRIARSD